MKQEIPKSEIVSVEAKEEGRLPVSDVVAEKNQNGAEKFSLLEDAVFRFMRDGQNPDSILERPLVERQADSKIIQKHWVLFEKSFDDTEFALHVLRCLNQLAQTGEFSTLATRTLGAHVDDLDAYILHPETMRGDSDTVRVAGFEGMAHVARGKDQKDKQIRRAKVLLGKNLPLLFDALERENEGIQYLDVFCDIAYSLDDRDFLLAKEWFNEFLEKEEYAEVESGALLARLAKRISGGNDMNRTVEFSNVLFNKYGWKADEYLRDWGHGSENYDEYLETIPRHLKNMINLERFHPGAVETLRREFRVTHFGRYTFELLEKQYRERNNDKMPYGVIVMPKDDHNGVFNQQVEVLAEFDESLRDAYTTRIVECESKWDIGRMLLTLDKRYGNNHKISFVILGGHGGGEEIRLGDSRNKVGESRERDQIFISDLTKPGPERGSYTRGVIKRISSFFEKDVVIVINSCCSGAKSGIGQRLSKVFGCEVIGPDAPAALVKLKAILSKDGKKLQGIRAKFDVGAHAKAYKKGNPVN